MMKKVSPRSLKINVAETGLPSDLSGTPGKVDEAQDASAIVEKNGKEVPSSPMKDHMASLNDQINSINFAATSIAAMFSPRKVALEKDVIRLQRALDSATQEMSKMSAAFRIKEMEELSQSEIKLIQQISSREKASMELRVVKSELFTALSGNKELKRDNEYLTSERSQLIINLESSEETLELTQEKLMKNEKERKHVFEEKNNLAIQLKGSQRELQQIQMEVNDIRNKELWASMEGQLQVKDKAKDDEERQKELVLNLAAANGKEEELQKKTVEMRSLRSELASALSINKELSRDKEYLTSERSELVINLETSENDLEACQLKLNKIEKESKVLLEERNNYSIQLKGAQKEFQQMSLQVNDIKNKELWEAMEGQLQAKDKAKADEEKEKERLASLNTLSLRDGEIKKQTAEIRSLKSELLSSKSGLTDLIRDKEYLTIERSELVINLETSETELEACQLKLTKSAKECKILLEERNSYSIQLKGAQKELQQVSMEVSDIKNKELWQAMEGQLQVCIYLYIFWILLL
jgi:chromosome segregation ATPase